MEIHKQVSLNLNIRGLGVSATLAMNERSKELKEQGRTIYTMGLGQSPFPVPVPVVDALKLHAHEKNYLPVKGLKTLRKAVAKYHRNKDMVEIDPDNILVGPGSKELMFLLQLCYYGEIIIPTPCWVSYMPQAQIVGRNVRLIHTEAENRYRLIPEELEELFEGEHDEFRPRLLVLNYPSNPSGCTYPKEDLERIADVARKYEVILLSDEIYGQLNFSGEHISISRFYPEGTIISSGISKWCGAGGWRLGTFAFPKNLDWLLDAMASVASETYTSVSAPIQYAAVRAFKGGIRIERYLWHARRILSTLGHKCTKILQDAGVSVVSPEGAFYLFPNFEPLAAKLKERGISDSVTLCEKLLNDTGVAVLPGVAFGRPPEELSARIAYVNFDGNGALAASETTPIDAKLPESFLDTSCGWTITAVKKIANWVNGEK